MKFGQLMEYNMTNNFIEKSYTKSKNWAVCFYSMPSRGLSKYIEIKLKTTCFFYQKDVWN